MNCSEGLFEEFQRVAEELVAGDEDRRDLVRQMRMPRLRAFDNPQPQGPRDRRLLKANPVRSEGQWIERVHAAAARDASPA